MMHAKTAVADSRWARIGSTNLNLNSWVGNWELDVAIEDADIARTMEAHYEADLEHSTEILLDAPRRVAVAATDPPPRPRAAIGAARTPDRDRRRPQHRRRGHRQPATGGLGIDAGPGARHPRGDRGGAGVLAAEDPGVAGCLH